MHMKSYFNPNQKRKKTERERERLESLWGSELGIALQKFSISDTKYIQQYVSQKRLRETPGEPEEIIPPALVPRSAARFPGRAVLSLDRISQTSGTAVLMITASQEELQRAP